MTENNNNSLIYICHKGKSQFALPILNFLSQKIKLYRSESKYGFIHKIRLKNNKIIWVEWARKQAKYISNCINENQKLIIRLHRYEMEDDNTLSQINWKKVSRVIFVNSEVEKKFNLLFPKVNTIMIPNAIETTLFKINNLNSDNSLLAYGQHYNPIKAYDKLIIMFANIIKQNSNFTLTIAGQEPTQKKHQEYFDHCNDLINKYDLTQNVHLLKLIDGKKEQNNLTNILYLLQNHNAIVSFSEIESFHYAFAEGLLSGLQGFCRGWRELNPNEFWRNWCYSNEKEMIKEILQWGQISEYERRIIGGENRDYIIKNFSSETIGKKYLNLISNL